MIRAVDTFNDQFAALSGLKPFRWQRRLFERLVEGHIPAALDLPTGLGKTSVMAIWVIARAYGARLPRRLVYVVDRRAVVDQATDEAEKLRKALEGNAEHFNELDEDTRTQAKQTANNLRKRLDFTDKLPISTLRGAHVDNREWLDDPAAPAIIVGTVDMIGSRLLFEGYGVSRKMRSYQAGLLGVDALIVLDEAHLVPPFAHLLRAIEQDASLRPNAEADRALLPHFVFLPLSATQRDSGEDKQGRAPFRLEAEDWKTDCIARRRLEAKKRLHLEQLADKGQDKQLAEAAWALAIKDCKFSRVAIFCDRRDKKDHGGGLSAQGVKEEIEKLAKGDKKEGKPAVGIHPVELFVGARRVHERGGAAKRLREFGFIGGKQPLSKPAFLVATSAGEVGVDIDADHMVSDLVAWERMVQRLGRVNRRGEGSADIKVFWNEPAIKNARKPTKPEKRAIVAAASRTVIENLPQIDGVFDASPGALRLLVEHARNDEALKAALKAATTPEPLRPALNRAFVDSWSMTSLEMHAGRPEVVPWLRGWVEEAPQTMVVWRTHLPIRESIGDWLCTSANEKEIEDFFEAAPPHQSEKLETDTYRVANWLQERGRALLKRERHLLEEVVVDEDTGPEASAADDIAAEEPAEQTAPQGRELRRDDIVALILSSRGDYANCYSLHELAEERKGKSKADFENEFSGKTLVIDARFGGMKDGVLNSASDDPPETADASRKWNKKAQFRVRRVKNSEHEEGWRFEDDFVLRRDDEGNALEWLVVEHFKDAARKEDARSISGKAQALAEHQSWTQQKAMLIAERIGLSGVKAEVLALAASLHDEGKKADRWQRAFNAPRDAERFGLAGPLAKTRGPINQAILCGYRHEFGSLPWVEENAEFKVLPDEWRDLVLHLVAAHHGRARPLIETTGCEDAPPSALGGRARDVALRFARLQKRWGPWGLAWWEALLRAADQQASRDNAHVENAKIAEDA